MNPKEAAKVVLDEHFSWKVSGGDGCPVYGCNCEDNRDVIKDFLQLLAGEKDN